MSEVTFHFSGRNFVVVGASSGMGREIALELAEAGANVLAIARNEKRLTEIREKYPERIETTMVDVLTANDEVWGKVLEHFVAEHGKINGGVYTAGLGGTTPLKSYERKRADEIVDTSFRGGIQFIHSVTKKRNSDEGASFLMFSSTAAYTGPKGLLFYAGAKAAIQAAVRVISKEIAGRKQRINSISPGYVKTHMTSYYEENYGMPKGVLGSQLFGIGNPQDISGMVLFLLSDRARFITGQDFVIDGGASY